jgi:hypothetical protein
MGLAFADREELMQPRATFEAHVERILQARRALVNVPVCALLLPLHGVAD